MPDLSGDDGRRPPAAPASPHAAMRPAGRVSVARPSSILPLGVPLLPGGPPEPRQTLQADRAGDVLCRRLCPARAGARLGRA